MIGAVQLGSLVEGLALAERAGLDLATAAQATAIGKDDREVGTV
jgi:hypothetical protein